ncbi:hypothetical protein CALCODRAFT_368212 [Calocera cornea HHB12733]|uniref:Uncharacterized protein n=1 Tax=Calocera cornea HHB12733 TaxID=1353952 RepID=A0A165EJB3_9BASI|nr:hypothetical protein CALCODRAFT_368212 [Calocera cornea HHB12733]
MNDQVMFTRRLHVTLPFYDAAASTSGRRLSRVLLLLLLLLGEGSLKLIRRRVRSGSGRTARNGIRCRPRLRLRLLIIRSRV